MIHSNLSAILGRKRLRLSQVERETGISRPTLAALYYDKSKGIRFNTLEILCRYLKVTVGELFTFEDLK